jgi:MFS family permease
MMALGLVYPLGAVLQGWLADRHGIRAVTVAGALVLLALCALTVLLRPSIFANLADPAPIGVSDVDGPVARRSPGAVGDGPVDPAPTGGTA